MSDPPMSLLLAGWGLALAIVPAVVLPILSALLERSGPIRLRHWAEEAGGGLRRLYDTPRRFEAFRLIVSLEAKVMPLIVLVLTWAVLAGLGVRGAWWIAPLLVAGLLFLIEGLNRVLVEQHSESALRRLTAVLRFLYLVSLPGIWVLSPFVAAAVEPAEEEAAEDDEASDEELNAFIDVGLREGILEPEEEALVRSIVDFGDTQVRSVMTPRVEIQSAAAELSLEELAGRFFDTKHARLPIHGDSIDQIVGILHIRDLFEAIHEGRETTAAELAKPPHYVPESKPLRELLAELQDRQQQMAIVVDEYGGVAGLVTVEDLVEEIVGEIADEHESPPEELVQLDDGRWRLEGRTSLEVLEELFELSIDVDELPYETVSGLVCGVLGYVPKAGEVVELHGLAFEIEKADERRILFVAVRRVELEEAREA